MKPIKEHILRTSDTRLWIWNKLKKQVNWDVYYKARSYLAKPIRIRIRFDIMYMIHYPLQEKLEYNETNS